jgi:WD40 repeat protein
MKYNLSLNNSIYSIAFSNNGLFAGVDWSRNFKLWNTSNGALVRSWTNHTGGMRSLAFDSKNMLASGSSDGTVKVWNISNGALVLDIATGHAIRCVRFGINGVLASASTSDTNIQIHNSTTGALITNLTALGSVYALAFDGTNFFASGGGNGGSFAGFITLWNTTTWTAIRNLTGHTVNIDSISFDKASLIASSGPDRTIRLWNKFTGELVRILTGHTSIVKSIAFDNNGNLASGSADRTIKIWRHNSNCDSSRYLKFQINIRIYSVLLKKLIFV